MSKTHIRLHVASSNLPILIRREAIDIVDHSQETDEAGKRHTVILVGDRWIGVSESVDQIDFALGSWPPALGPKRRPAASAKRTRP